MRKRPYTTTVQDSAYSCRVWITLIKLSYTLYGGAYLTLIFTRLRGYASGCYLRYCGLPRRTLLGSPVNKPGHHAGQMPKGVAARNDAVRAKDAACGMSSRIPPPGDCGGVEPPLRPSAAETERGKGSLGTPPCLWAPVLGGRGCPVLGTMPG